MPKQEIDSQYLKFIDQALKFAKQIPRWFSRFSNKIFDNHQKLVLLVLKQKLRVTYRDLVEILKVSYIPLYIGLKKIPHHTTLVKFAKRVRNKLNLLLNIRSATNVAVDASGFGLDTKSYYYRTKWNSERKWKTCRYMKLSLSVDTDKLLILGYKIRKKTRHDTIDFEKVLKDVDVDYVFADKGYDSKSNRQFVKNKLKAMPVIPVRNSVDFYGYFKASKKIDGSNYHQRSKVETVFSMIKRKYGSILMARSDPGQKAELRLKLIAHNVDRLITSVYDLLRVSAEPFNQIDV